MKNEVDKRLPRVKALAWLVLTGLVLIRDVNLLIEPRFYAEEGVMYFSNAYDGTAWEALTQNPKRYLSLLANIAVYLATFVPLLYAPLVTTIVSAGVQAAILAYIVWGRLIGNPSLLLRVILGASLLTVGLGEAIWLNSITLHSHVPILVFFVLLEERSERSRAGHAVILIMLFVSGLEGVTACMLAPLFAYRWIRSRDAFRLGQTLALGSAAVIQALMILSTQGLLTDQRFSIGPSAFERLLYYLLVFPSWTVAPSDLVWFSIAVLAATFLWACFRYQHLRLHVIVFLVLICGPFALSLNMVGGPRYAHAGAICLCLLQLRVLTSAETSRWLRYLGGSMLSLSLVGGMYALSVESDLMDTTGWTTWAEEVESLESNPRHWIAVNPQTSTGTRKIWRFRTAIDDIDVGDTLVTKPINLEEGAFEMPVVYIPVTGNFSIALRETSPDSGVWNTESLTQVDDSLVASAEISKDFRSLRFFDSDGRENSFEIVEWRGGNDFVLNE